MSMSAPITYEVTIHAYPTSLLMVPCGLVTELGSYSPSSFVRSQIEQMWRQPKPRQVGMASESMVMEILNGGRICIRESESLLVCERLPEFARRTSIRLTPTFGIRSDDIITIAKTGNRELIFVTESKGTTLGRGFSHTTEAKIFYQLGRTVRVLERSLSNVEGFDFGGIIFAEVNHFAKMINLGIVDQSGGLPRILPDSWMYQREGDESVFVPDKKR